MTRGRTVATAAAACALSLALVIGACQMPSAPPPVPNDHRADDLVGSWHAEYAGDGGNLVAVTYELNDDRTFRLVTTVTGGGAAPVVLSRTVATGTWESEAGDGAGLRGTVRLHVTACDGDACGTDVNVGATFELTFTASGDGEIKLEAAPGTTATREPLPSDGRPATMPLNASAGDREVTLAWDPAGAAVERWEYRFSTDGGATWTAWLAIAGSGPDTAGHTVTSLTNGTSYTFQVRARDAHGNGPATATTTATPRAPPAAAPPAGNPATNICLRTPLVRERIVQAVQEKDACADITVADLAAIAEMRLCRQPPGPVLTALKAKDFAGLANLERLDLRAGADRATCGLTDLPDGIFRDLSRLTWLRLSDNHLGKLRAEMFEGLDSVVALEVRAANLAELPRDLFRHLPALAQLDLAENRLTALPGGAFAGLSSLQLLTLAGNTGAPFRLALQLKDASDGTRNAIRVALPVGSPFPLTVELQSTGGTLSDSSITLRTGGVRSEPVTISSSDDATVTVSLTAPPMPVDPGSSDPQTCATPAADRVPCFTGFQVVAGDGITFPLPRFVIESDNTAATARTVVEAINDNSRLKTRLEGHVLSSSSVARTFLGLPGAGSDFSDAWALAAKLADTTLHFRRGVRGNGAGWGYAGFLSYTNWVDGVFFAAARSTSITPFVVGVPTGANPVADAGQTTAAWSGAVAGRDTAHVGHLSGNAKLTYDFAAGELDAVFNNLAYYFAGDRFGTAKADISWNDLTVTNGLFGDCTGGGDCIRGRFFYDHDHTAAAAVGGVFRKGSLMVAFGANLD